MIGRGAISPVVCASVAAVGLLVGWPGASRLAAQQARTPVSVGFVSFAAQGWPFYVAEALGAFEQQGLALDVTTLGSSPLVATAVVSGSLDVGVPDMTSLTRAVQQGGSIVWFMTQVSPPIYGLLARAEIGSLGELRGRTIIMDSPNGLTAILSRRMLAPAGLTFDDVNRVYAGATPDRLAALQSGAVDAAMLLQPFDFTAERLGYRRLANSTSVVPAFEFSGYAGRTDWLSRNEETVGRFIRGYLAGLRFLYEPANRERAIQALIERTRLSPDDAAATYELYILRERVFPEGGRINPVGVQAVLEALAEMGDLPTPPPPASRFVTTAYVDRFGQ